jgi:CBS domain containing-hemolysin-like protein
VTNTFLLLISSLVLFALDLIVVGMRFAFEHASHARLLSRNDAPEPRVEQAVKLVRKFPRLQACLAFGRTSILFLWVGVVLYIVLWQPVELPLYVTAVLLILAALLLIWLEWLIRGLVLRDAEGWALRFSPLAQGVLFVLGPITGLTLYLSPSGQNGGGETSQLVVDDLKTMVDAGQQEGLLEQEERMMIHSIFDMGETLAREIMVPRIDMRALDVQTPLPEAVDALLESGFTRVPVYEETVDNILGLLYAKDLLRVWRKGDQLGSLRELLRPASFVPEAKKIDDLLTEMQSQRVHIAIVVDEYGGVAGLVTLEDIVEEIFGEIRDEYDQAEELPYQELADGGYLFLGRVDLDDINEVLSTNLPTNEADSIGGFIYSRMGRVPNSGESIQVGNLLLTVDQVSGRRISKVHAQWVHSPDKKETHAHG